MVGDRERVGQGEAKDRRGIEGSDTLTATERITMHFSIELYLVFDFNSSQSVYLTTRGCCLLVVNLETAI